MKTINIIGAGFAGVEAANFLANLDYKINLFEMRGKVHTEAHATNLFAEPLCANSFKSNLLKTPSGALKAEMRVMNSITLECAEETKVPAGEALAVDRVKFAELVTQKIKANKNINVINEEITSFENFSSDEIVIIASGPLTSENLYNEIQKNIGKDDLYFYDAISPIIAADSIDMNFAFYGSRFDKGKDYINCVLNKDEYINFVNELANANLVEPKKIKGEDNFEKWQFYPGCTPIEVIAKSGVNSMRFAQCSPKGFDHDELGKKAYSIIQLRKENNEASAFSLVGFQTRLTYSEQKRVFKMIPALKNAEFLRLGSVHRNSFINSPKILNDYLAINSKENIYFAGQITGVEGYMESAASGLLTALIIHNKLSNKENVFPPPNTMIGVLYRHLRKAVDDFQPSGINFGLLNFEDFTGDSAKIKIKNKKEKREAVCAEAISNFKIWFEK